MASLITETEFRSSRYADVADNVVQLSQIIAQAEDYVEQYLDRKIAKATYTETHYPTQKYLFPYQYPILSISSLKRRRFGEMRQARDDEGNLRWDGTEPVMEEAWQELDLSNIRYAHPEAPILEYVGYPNLSGYEVEITYEAGYDPVPPTIKAAVIIQTVLLSTVDLSVFGSDDGKQPSYLYMQDEVYRYLQPYKRMRRFY